MRNDNALRLCEPEPKLDRPFRSVLAHPLGLNGRYANKQTENERKATQTIALRSTNMTCDTIIILSRFRHANITETDCN